MVTGVRGEAGAPWKVSEHGEAMSTTAAAMVTVMMRLLQEKMDVGQAYCGILTRNRFGTSNFCLIYH